MGANGGQWEQMETRGPTPYENDAVDFGDDIRDIINYREGDEFPSIQLPGSDTLTPNYAAPVNVQMFPLENLLNRTGFGTEGITRGQIFAIASFVELEELTPRALLGWRILLHFQDRMQTWNIDRILIQTDET